MKAFGIIHFAGTVFYHAEKFLEKNRDTFSADLFDILHDTKSKFLSKLFEGERSMVSNKTMQASHLITIYNLIVK